MPSPMRNCCAFERPGAATIELHLNGVGAIRLIEQICADDIMFIEHWFRLDVDLNRGRAHDRDGRRMVAAWITFHMDSNIAVFFLLLPLLARRAANQQRGSKQQEKEIEQTPPTLHIARSSKR